MCSFININGKDNNFTKKAGILMHFGLCIGSCHQLSLQENIQRITAYLDDKNYKYWYNGFFEHKSKFYILLYSEQQCLQFIDFLNSIKKLEYLKSEICYKSLPWDTYGYKHPNIFLNKNKNRPFTTLYEYLQIKYIDFGFSNSSSTQKTYVSSKPHKNHEFKIKQPFMNRMNQHATSMVSLK